MKFLSGNWYKLIMSCSSLIFAVAVLIYAIRSNTAQAKDLPAKVNGISAPTSAEIFAVSDGRSAFFIRWDLNAEEAKIIYTLPLR